ncbi:MAG: MFS transporter [Burkholderiaceae bacterium]
MIRSIAAVSSLLSGMGILLVGSGLLGLIIALRGANEGFSDLTIGWLMSGFYVGYIVGAWICPRIISSVGHIRAFTAFAACSAAVALAYGLAVHPLVWWLLRVASGVTLIGLYMVIESWLNERATERRAQVFSVYMMVNLIAVAAGQVLIAGYGADDMASLAIVAMLFCFGLVPVALTPVAQPQTPSTERLSMARLYKQAPVGAAGALFSGLVTGSFWSLGAVFARGLGLPDTLVALFIVATIMGGATMQWPIGWISDRIDRRLVMMFTTIGMVVAIGFLAFTPAHAIGLLFVLAFLFGGFAFTLYSLAVAQTHDRFSIGEVLEATKSLLLLHGVGAAIGPLLTGLAMTFSERGFGLSLGVIGMLLCAFTALRLQLDSPVPVDEKSSFAPLEQTSAAALELDPRTPVADLAPVFTHETLEAGTLGEARLDAADAPLFPAEKGAQLQGA